jgi:hypothetical protein
MNYKKYLKTDGTMTGWMTSPENDTDREIFTLAPLARRYVPGESMEHKKYGRLECVQCERIENDDQCGEWDGPSFLGHFVSEG